MTDYIAVYSDLHANSEMALSVSGFALDNGGSYQPSDSQRWLDANYKNSIAVIKQRLKRGDRLTTVLNGDLVEGDVKGRTNKILTRNPARIVELTAAILAPLYDISHQVLFISGTPSHAGIDGSLEELVANDCDLAVTNPVTGKKLWSHAYLDVGGITIKIQHHGPTRGNRKNLRKALDDLAEKMIIEHTVRGEKLPRLALFSHGHFFCDTENRYPVRVITTPAWQLAPDYVYMKPAPEISDIGAILLGVKDGILTCHPMIYPVKPEKPLPIQSILPRRTS